jgi:hypothetical protein
MFEQALLGGIAASRPGQARGVLNIFGVEIYALLARRCPVCNPSNAPLLLFDSAVLSGWAGLLPMSIVELGVDQPKLRSAIWTHSNSGS